MRGTPQAQPEFLTVINLNACVPANHPLRSIKRRVDAILKKLPSLFDKEKGSVREFNQKVYWPQKCLNAWTDPLKTLLPDYPIRFQEIWPTKHSIMPPCPRNSWGFQMQFNPHLQPDLAFGVGIANSLGVTVSNAGPILGL